MAISRRKLRQPPRWCTRTDAAVHLGVGLATFDRLIASGVVAAHKLPGSRLVFIDLAELDATLEAHTIKTAQTTAAP